MSQLKLLVIGIDGGTWEVAKRLIIKGKLPTMAKLRRNGCYGDLISSLPCDTLVPSEIWKYD